MPDFDYQWKNLHSPFIEYNKDRITEFLNHTGLKRKLIKGTVKEITGMICLDAGCGNGRYTYAMLELGASRVDSFDISPEAVKKCKTINPNVEAKSLFDLEPNPAYDFVLCWGVLNHVEKPREGFSRIASQVKPNGLLHIMVYHKETQALYHEGRKLWPSLSHEERIAYCEKMIEKYNGNLHGWWDTLNPTYNHSFYPDEIVSWFEEERFCNIRVITGKNDGKSININGSKSNLQR